MLNVIAKSALQYGNETRELREGYKRRTEESEMRFV
jgi:hypothetical protein